MFARLLLFLLLFSRSLPLSDWNTKLDSLSLVTGDTSYKSTFARVVRLEASCFLADGTPCSLETPVVPSSEAPAPKPWVCTPRHASVLGGYRASHFIPESRIGKRKRGHEAEEAEMLHYSHGPQGIFDTQDPDFPH
jgi:hypothetical protein